MGSQLPPTLPHTITPSRYAIKSLVSVAMTVYSASIIPDANRARQRGLETPARTIIVGRASVWIYETQCSPTFNIRRVNRERIYAFDKVNSTSSKSIRRRQTSCYYKSNTISPAMLIKLWKTTGIRLKGDCIPDGNLCSWQSLCARRDVFF